MRINKYIASCGVCSRRKADELISNGNVKVNGAVLTQQGYDVSVSDMVEVNGVPLIPEQKKVYFLLNKPVGFVTTVSDQFGRPTAVDLIDEPDIRIFPVGRLDYDTSGLLIMTNDGDFAYRVSHPKNELEKTYRARVQGMLSDAKCRKLRKGMDLGGFTTSPAKVKIVRDLPGQTIVDISVHEGKNRQIRKMFSAVGNEVIELERIAIGNIRIGRLLAGHYRRLTREEIASIVGEK